MGLLCIALERTWTWLRRWSTKHKTYVHCESKKNCATFIFTVTLANVGRFLKFFQCRNQKETAHNKTEKSSHRSLTLLLHYLVKLTLVWRFAWNWRFCIEKHKTSFLQICGLDLNPVDYQIWADMHQRGVYQRKIHTIDELKQRLNEVWCGLEQLTVDMAIDHWRKSLRACVRTYSFWTYRLSWFCQLFVTFLSCFAWILHRWIKQHCCKGSHSH